MTTLKEKIAIALFALAGAILIFGVVNFGTRYVADKAAQSFHKTPSNASTLRDSLYSTLLMDTLLRPRAIAISKEAELLEKWVSEQTDHEAMPLNEVTQQTPELRNCLELAEASEPTKENIRKNIFLCEVAALQKLRQNASTRQ